MSLTRRLLLFVLGAFGCASPSQQPPDPATEAEQREIYDDLRSMALEMRLPGASPSAALMELGLDDGTATLVAVADGATSLYFSNGGGIIGAGEHEPVSEASAKYLRTARDHTDLMEAAKDRPLPAAGHVRFYVVTEDGLLSAEAEEPALAGGAHPLSDLYAAGQELLTAVRLASSGQ